MAVSYLAVPLMPFLGIVMTSSKVLKREDTIKVNTNSIKLYTSEEANKKRRHDTTDQ